ncbi:hypothetical protein PsorP6_013127 [Peronosclerospora sorghi]|uniref:Uncharacterized protein n=1 Tax=Peronosclerospora sorghi TaxID=230839 RepID=A0ACC0WFW6_9STRA|nr:hypothetical protein PsorP6_013127 [Peronosclerospora sorghi]
MRRSSASADVPSLRPTVTYTYLQPDADEATFHVEFAMEKVKILLMSEQQVDSPVEDSISIDSIVQVTLTNSTSMITIGEFVEIVASDFLLAFDSEYRENPRLAIHYTWDDIALTGELDLFFSKSRVPLFPRLCPLFLLFFRFHRSQIEHEIEQTQVLSKQRTVCSYL